MPTVRVLYDLDGWAYHSCARALVKYAPPDFQVTIAPVCAEQSLADALGDTAPDLVFLLEYLSAPRVRQALSDRGWSSKLLTAFSFGWPGHLAQFYTAYRASDALLVSNREYRERTGCLPRTYTIPYGVDPDVFNVRVPLRHRRPKVLWTGSELYRDVKRYDDLVVPLAAHIKWHFGIESDHWLVDSYSAARRSPEAMAAWYNQGTVLVCASRAEGTPNPPLEAAAAGCVVVSTPVGNMPDLIRHGLNGYLVDHDLESLAWGVRTAVHNYRSLAPRMQADIRAWLWPARSHEFFGMFREVLAGDTSPAGDRPDLSSAVTVFVTSVGAPEYELCRDLLARQDCTFTLRLIEHVTPLPAALQRMVDECATPFYVQVDEDMLLYPHAIRTLYEQIVAADGDVAMVVGRLYDVHLGRPIDGVKIFRHELARRYPWHAYPSVVDRLARIEADGHRIVHAAGDEDVVHGLHGTRWTSGSLYQRYRLLERLRRGHPKTLEWFAGHHRVFLERFLSHPTEANFFALMGVVAGALSAEKAGGLLRDARRDRHPPGFAALRRFLDEVTQTEPAP